MSETELLARCRQGDQSAFAQLVLPQRDRAWAVCLRLLDSREDAEDAMQNALIAAWQNLHKFNGDARFSTWFYRVVSNAALDIGRKRARSPRTIGGDDELMDVGDFSTPGVANRVVDTDAVHRALAELPSDFREAVVLREFVDMSYAEIAEHQGVGINTVRSRISRARTQLVSSLSAT